MIVKDEASVITETLESVAPFIDTYSIVDTGSSDDTIDVIKAFFRTKGITGRVHERPWKDFGHNRSEALELARAEGGYALMFDADDLLHGQPDFSNLKADGYLVRIASGNLRYWRHQIFSSRRQWRYEGVLHEYATCDEPGLVTERQSGDWWIESRRLGARSNATDKYDRDAEILLADLAKNPDNSRSVFYLAQSYFDARRWDLALERYTARVSMGGWDEEVFYSKMRSGECLIHLDRPRGEILDALLGAWEFRPSRAEPLHLLARWHREHAMYAQAAMFARTALSIPFPHSDALFVSSSVYDWQVRDELAVASYYIGELQTSLQHSTDLLRGTMLPEDQRSRVERNLQLAVQALATRAPQHSTQH